MTNWWWSPIIVVVGIVAGYIAGIPIGRWLAGKLVAALDRHNPRWFMAPPWHPYCWLPGWPKRPSNV